MKTSMLHIILLMTFFAINQQVYANEIGKIIQSKGQVQRIIIVSGERLPVERGTKLKAGEIIMTAMDASASILLKNSTIIQLKKNTKISLISLRLKKNDMPTEIQVEYGKLHISSPLIFDDKSLVLTTPTAIISLVYGDLAIIVAEKETRALVYKNKIGVANIKPEFRTAYIVYPGEEISIKQNRPPAAAKKVKTSVMNWWLGYYKIINKNQSIIRIDKDNGIIDWLLRKREF